MTPANPSQYLIPKHDPYWPLQNPANRCQCLRPVLIPSIPCCPNRVTLLDTCQLLLMPPHSFRVPIAADAIRPLMTSAGLPSSTTDHFRCLPNFGDSYWPLPFMSLPSLPGNELSVSWQKWVIYHGMDGKQSHRFGWLLLFLWVVL